MKSIVRLRNAGHDVAAVREDAPGASDAAVFQRAAEEGRILLTFDRDFGALVFQGVGSLPTGVVFLRFQPAFAEHASQVILELLELPGVELRGRFTVADGRRIRQRVLRPA